MSQVSVNIDGKTYRMACDPGQEDHLIALAGRVDQYVTHLKSSFGEIGDLRLTVMSAIMIMDELDGVQKRLKVIEEEIDAARAERDDALAKADRADESLGEKLSAVAETIETIAAKLS